MGQTWHFVNTQEASLAWLQQLWNDPDTLRFTAGSLLYGEALLRHLTQSSWRLALHARYGPAGLVDFYRFDRNQEKVDLRFRLHPHVRGRGLAYPMAKAWINSRPSQVQAQVRADHWRSKRLLRRLGFSLKTGFIWGGAPWELWEFESLD